MIQPFSNVHLLYKATRDGFTNSAFHSKCDGKENTVLIIKNNLNHVFGGYSSAKWSKEGSIADPNAFIFSLRRNGKSNNYKLLVDPKHVSSAIYGDSSYYRFCGTGSLDICIHENSNTNKGSQSGIECYIPPVYPIGSNATTFLAGNYDQWLTTEIEVYQIFK